MIADRKIEKIGLDVALGAKEMLRGLQIEEVRAKSAGAATFYVWVRIVNPYMTNFPSLSFW